MRSGVTRSVPIVEWQIGLILLAFGMCTELLIGNKINVV